MLRVDTPLQHHSNYGDLLEILVYLGRYVQESFPVEQKSLRAHCKYNVSSFLVEIVFNIFFSLLYSTVGTSTASILPCEILFSPQGLKAGLHRCQLEHSQPIQLLAFIWSEGTIPQSVRGHNLNSGCRRSNLTQQKQSLPHTKKSPPFVVEMSNRWSINLNNQFFWCGSLCGIAPEWEGILLISISFY